MQLPFPNFIKWCPACKQYKAIDDFNKNKSKSSGLDGQCRACVKHRRKKPVPHIANPDAIRTCRTCGQIKTYDQLVKHKNMIDGVDTLCLKCNNHKVGNYNSEHPGRKSKYDKQRYPAVQKQTIERARRHYLDNRYTPTYQAKSKSLVARRRARILNAPGTYTHQDVRLQYEIQGRKCYWCSNPLDKYHADHYYPLSRGGTNWPENIVASCAQCNCSKNNRIPYTEWQPPNPLHSTPIPKTERISQPR